MSEGVLYAGLVGATAEGVSYTLTAADRVTDMMAVVRIDHERHKFISSASTMLPGTSASGGCRWRLRRMASSPSCCGWRFSIVASSSPRR